MEGYDAATYGERIADVYDEWYAEAAFLETDAAVAKLAELAGEGPALELAIGTGRVALPLAERGIEVHGIDTSQAMVAKLREKPGGAEIPVTIGDFADVSVEGTYPLVYVVFNTLFALESQDEQVRCFQNVAARLVPGGVFVVEAFVPEPEKYDGRVGTSRIESDRVQIDVARVDRAEQRSESQHIVLTPQGARFYPVSIRWAYPAELDLMARLAGLRLRERWSSWDGQPFTKTSGKHISVYELPH
jgi:SAM-dependent methyltransferase